MSQKRVDMSIFFIHRVKYSLGKNIRRGKSYVGENFRHFTKISPLFPDEVFPDKVEPGYYTTSHCISMNIKRRRSAAYHHLPSAQNARKIIRAQRKGDKNKNKEGLVYKAEGFNYIVICMLYWSE